MPDIPAGKDTADPAAVQDYQLRYCTLARNCTYGIFQLSTGDNIHVLFANRFLETMLGYSAPETIVGMSARDVFIHPSDFDTILEDVRRDGIITGREIRLRHKGGSEIWVSVQAWLLPASHRVVVEGIAEDITEHRALEEEMQYHASELNRHADALANANKKLNLLSSITRHDLLNKLTILRGQLELMKMDSSDPAVQTYLADQEKIIQTITHHVQFTRDYQDLGVESPRWFDVKDVIGLAVGSLSLTGIDVSIETGNLWIYADPMLEKVFYNLVENSLRHAGTVTGIRFRAVISGGTAIIICEDDGCGVPAEFKEDIFNRRHFTHTGLGLYLAREILAITGLSIAETGTLGNGARFEITVPGDRFRVGNSSG